MTKLTIKLSDCYNQEVFDRLIQAVGIQSVDAFEDEDIVKATTLSFHARLDKTYPAGCLILSASELKKDAFDAICDKMGVSNKRPNLCLETSFPELS